MLEDMRQAKNQKIDVWPIESVTDNLYNTIKNKTLSKEFNSADITV